MSQRKDLIRKILDQGRSALWTAQTDTAGETDVFLMEIVMPLRKLERQGLFPQLDEHLGNYNGVQRSTKFGLKVRSIPTSNRERLVMG